MPVVFVKTFKGYEDRTTDLYQEVNSWIVSNKVNVVSVQTVLAHEPEGRSGMGDLLYTVIYKADKPVPE
ncbi:MAG: hypothetical protein ACLFTT_03975 [Candidatus Hydrogenedentota bacterium]